MRVIIITGTTRGLGKALLEILSQASDDYIIAISRRILPTQEAMVNVAFFNQDLKYPEELARKFQLSRLLPEGVNEIIFIDNAATVGLPSRIGSLSQSSILETLYINVLSPLLIANEVVKVSQQLSCQCRLLHIGTGAAKQAIAGLSLYCASKSAMAMFYDVASLEGVDTLYLNPGVMNTSMQTQIRQDLNPDFPMHRYFIDLNQEGRLREPLEVARELLERYDLL